MFQRFFSVTNFFEVIIIMKKAFVILVALFIMQGCTNKAPELKSPCVGTEDSPCGLRIPVNDHWLKGSKA